MKILALKKTTNKQTNKKKQVRFIPRLLSYFQVI